MLKLRAIASRLAAHRWRSGAGVVVAGIGLVSSLLTFTDYLPFEGGAPVASRDGVVEVTDFFGPITRAEYLQTREVLDREHPARFDDAPTVVKSRMVGYLWQDRTGAPSTSAPAPGVDIYGPTELGYVTQTRLALRGFVGRDVWLVARLETPGGRLVTDRFVEAVAIRPKADYDEIEARLWVPLPKGAMGPYGAIVEAFNQNGLTIDDAHVRPPR